VTGDETRVSTTEETAADSLARELYWAAPPVSGSSPGARSADGTSDLAIRWGELEATLRRDHASSPLPDDQVLQMGRPFKRRIKRLTFRLLRPLMRRYDRIGADLALLGLETSRELEATRQDQAALIAEIQELRSDLRRSEAAWDEVRGELRASQTVAHEHDVRIGSAASELEALSRRLASAGGVTGAGPASTPAIAAVPSPAAEAALPDAFYWRFEAALRGSQESIEQKLLQYRDLADQLREQHGGSPLWLDLGCGEGQFLALLQGWGWRVLGMDISAQAVATCEERGIDAVQGTLPDFLLTYDGEAPAAMSAVQVVEHLPPASWLPLLQYSQRGLVPGGALVVETIYPLNVDALANWFFGDITHTWPANPETLRVMAGFAGFDSVDVRLMNPDEDERPQDYALIARKS
jgi:SAM-dependent methyltransferase